MKIVRVLTTTVLGIIVLFAALIIALTIFINPNNYKSQISQKVYQATGRELVFNGDIHWSYFPWLGLQINKVQLNNAKGFGDLPFARIQEADIKIKFMPLLKGIISIGDVKLDGLELNLSKNAKGITNWQDLSAIHSTKIQNSTIKPIDPPSGSATADPVVEHPSKINFDIASVTVTDGHITWIDLQKQQAVDINHLEVKSKDIKIAQDFPVNIQFNVVSKQPAITETIKFSTDAFIDPAKKTYLLKNIRLENNAVGTIFPGGKMLLNAQGALTITKQQELLNLAKITATFNNTNVIGNAQIMQFSTSPVIQAAFIADRFQQKAFEASNINVKLSMKNNILNISPITANLYQGNYLGNILINLKGKVPQITADNQLTNVQTEPLFNALSNVRSIQLTGTANLNAHLTMQGADKDSLIKSLNGQGKIAVNNGVLKGINLSYWISLAKALINHQASPAQPNVNQTDFGNLTGSFTIANGLLQNNDLLLQAPNWHATGFGAINLVGQQIDYKLSIQSFTSANQPEGIPVTLEIKGPFTQLAITPAVEDILKAQIQNQVMKNKDKIQQFLQKNLSKDIGSSLQQQLNNFLH